MGQKWCRLPLPTHYKKPLYHQGMKTPSFLRGGKSAPAPFVFCRSVSRGLLRKKKPRLHAFRPLPHAVNFKKTRFGSNILLHDGDVYKEFSVSPRLRYFVRNFLQEVHLQCLLSSADKGLMPVVKNLWYAKKKGRYVLYIQMPLVGTQNLEKLLAADCFPKEQHQRLVTKMIGKMDLFSANGFLWWDCKPANFVLTNEGGLQPVDCGSLYLIKLEKESKKVLRFLNRLFLRLHLRLALKFAPAEFVSLCTEIIGLMLAADFLVRKAKALSLLEALVVASEESEDREGPEGIDTMDAFYLFNTYASRCGYSAFSSNEDMLTAGALEPDAGLKVRSCV